MKDLLTFLVLLIGINGYCNPNPYIVPTPNIRYINLELPSLNYLENNTICTSDCNLKNGHFESHSRIHTSLVEGTPFELEHSKRYSSSIYEPFSTTDNTPDPPSEISHKGVDFGGGDIEFGDSDWGDGEEEEPGYDPYPMNNDFQIFSFLIFIYTLFAFSKKHRDLRYKTNHHEKSV